MKSGFCVQGASMSLWTWPKRFAGPDPGKIKARNNTVMTSLGWGPQFGYPFVKQYSTETKNRFLVSAETQVVENCRSQSYICPSPLWGFENTLFRPFACHLFSFIVNCFAEAMVAVNFTLMSSIYSICTCNPPKCELKRYMSSGQSSFGFIPCDPKYSAGVVTMVKNVLLFRTCSWKVSSCTACKGRSTVCLC